MDNASSYYVLYMKCMPGNDIYYYNTCICIYVINNYVIYHIHLVAIRGGVSMSLVGDDARAAFCGVGWVMYTLSSLTSSMTLSTAARISAICNDYMHKHTHTYMRAYTNIYICVLPPESRRSETLT